MNQIQKLNEKSRQLLKEKGYEISVSFFKGWDRREDSPDYVTLTIKKEDDMMFQTEFRTQIEGESYDEFGDSVVAECLDVRNSQMYVEKKDLLAEKIKKLRDLKSKLNIFHKIYSPIPLL